MPSFTFICSVFISLFLFCNFSLAAAQEITLFSSERNSLSKNSDKLEAVAAPRSKTHRAAVSQLKLKGISYINDQYHIFLQDNRNKVFSLSWDGKKALIIPDYEHLQIDAIDLASRSLSISFIAGKHCQDSKSSGLSCINDTQGQLFMVRGPAQIITHKKKSTKAKTQQKTLSKEKPLKHKTLAESMLISKERRTTTNKLPENMKSLRAIFGGGQITPKK